MGKRILITGGAGFIGSHLAARSLSLGNEVVVADDLSTGDEGNVPAGAELVEMDISGGDEYRKLRPFDFDAVFHLAAQSSGEISNENPVRDLEVNTLGTLLLLSACRKGGVRRFLYSSSMAVYGNLDHPRATETDLPRPVSFYGVSKLASEHYIRHFAHEGLEPTIFRLFSVYGPGQNLANLKQGMVSIFLAYLLEGKPVHVKGSGDRFRDFIYIDDVLDAWMGALERPVTIGKTYNLGTGRSTTVSRLVEEEIRACGQDPASYPVLFQGSTPYDQFGLSADISLVSAETGWVPRVELREGLARMVAWAAGGDRAGRGE